MKHGLDALEVVKRLEAGFALKMGLAGSRSERTDHFGLSAAAARTGNVSLFTE